MWRHALYGSREISSLATVATPGGPRREGEEPKPTIYGPEKSDCCVVAMKWANKNAQAEAEFME
jgi:hypothetical protein